MWSERFRLNISRAAAFKTDWSRRIRWAGNTHQHAVAIIQPVMYQGNYQLLERRSRYGPAYLTQLAKSGKATRQRVIGVRNRANTFAILTRQLCPQCKQ